eukprot:10362716-Karenia_brevis.AAC.1
MASLPEERAGGRLAYVGIPLPQEKCFSLCAASFSFHAPSHIDGVHPLYTRTPVDTPRKRCPLQ